MPKVQILYPGFGLLNPEPQTLNPYIHIYIYIYLLLLLLVLFLLYMYKHVGSLGLT